MTHRLILGALTALALAALPAPARADDDDWEDYWEDYRERLRERQERAREAYEDWLEDQREREEEYYERWRDRHRRARPFYGPSYGPWSAPGPYYQLPPPRYRLYEPAPFGFHPYGPYVPYGPPSFGGRGGIHLRLPRLGGLSIQW